MAPVNCSTSLENIPLMEGLVWVDLEDRICAWNESMEALTGIPKEVAVGRYCHEDIINPVGLDGSQLCLQKTILKEGLPYEERDIYIQHLDGYRILVRSRRIPWVVEGLHMGTVETFYKKYAGVTWHLWPQDLKDEVTGLANKKCAHHYLTAQMSFQRNTQIALGILILDIDNFEAHNMTYGREVGDAILGVVSRSLKNTFGDADLIVRLNADEFMLIYTHITSNALKEKGEKLRIVMENTSLRSQTFKEVSLTVSIGGTLFRPRDSAESIVERALYFVKKSKIRGGNRSAIS